MSEQLNQQRELTAAEIAEYKKKSLEFYKDRISFMKVQLEFERLSADIEETKLRGLIATLKYAQITAPPKEEDDEEETDKSE